MGIGMMAAATVWSRVVQQDREAELVFRGEAIVRALERYQRDRPGTLPETLDELVEGRYLRRAWRDPMTRTPFRILRAESRAAARPAAAAVPPTTNPMGDREEAATRVEGSRGIIGVASTSELLSFRSYEGARRYSQWRFEVSVSAGAGARSREPES